jgi:hypothetical protein
VLYPPTGGKMNGMKAATKAAMAENVIIFGAPVGGRTI